MRNVHLSALAASSIAIAVAVASPAYAQETTSAIRGTVVGGGHPVGGAKVTILDTATGAKSTVTTSADGAFSADGLRAGDSYSVSVAADGFAAATVDGVVTVVAQTYDLPINLGAEQGGTIVVTASKLKGAGAVTQGPATVLSAAQILNVASVNRDVRDLSRRDPFARLDDSPSGGRAISFAGQNARYNRFTVDGVPITDSFGLNTDGLPSRRSPIPFDAIGQFQAKVAPFDIREGNFQGGAINVVLRSGTNKFQGTGFYSFSNDALQGKTTGSLTVNVPAYKYQNFGAELSGPIIKDKLFFMIAAERLRASKPLAEGPTDNNAGSAIANLTQADVDLVTSIAKSKYGYDTGGVLKLNGDKDDRIVGKIDWNISSGHRASFTYTNAKDEIYINTSNTFLTAPTGLSLASNSYIQGNKLKTYVGQINSEWSSRFSTEVRAFYKDYVRLQDPLLGRGFAEFDVCTAPTSDRTAVGAAASASTSCNTAYSTVAFGPDISRQTNQLNVKTFGALVQARLKLGDHDFKMVAEMQDAKTFNAFVQRSSGQYYFDSIADFQAGNAQRFRYQTNPQTLNANDAAAAFRYQSYNFGIQDHWRANSMLSFDMGLRFDMYGGSSRPVLNNNFLTRYGFTNQTFVSGLSVLQPRLGFNFKPNREFALRGGIGVFAGGTPDVYVSNSFSNTGVLTNAIDIQQLNNGTYNNASGAAILSNVNGATIPSAANTVVKSASLLTTAPTNALSPNFKLPRQLRTTISGDWTPAELGPLGSGWNFGADFLYSRVLEQVDFTDIRIRANGLLTPDGRTRYSPITTTTDTNSDILLTNSQQGRSYIAVARLGKKFNFGLDTSISYTFSNVKDKNPATSSVASSNYGAGVAFDPNGPAYGTSNDEVRNSIKFNLSWEHAFYGDYKTTLSVFGESRNGHTYSITFRDPATRSTVFGTIGTGTRYLMYIPTGVADPKVSFDTAANAAAIDSWITSMGLDKYRGQVAPRNSNRSAWITKLDLHFAQEVPTFVGNSRVTLFADVENFTNLLNKNWGQIVEYPFAYTVTPVTVACLSTPVATGTAATSAQTAGNSGVACAQYRYAPNVKDAGGNFVAPTTQIYAQQSLYTIRFGVRFSF